MFHKCVYNNDDTGDDFRKNMDEYFFCNIVILFYCILDKI